MEGSLINIDLTGHVALVCGASQGIGRATAKKMAEAGAAVIALARSRDKLASLIEELAGPKEKHSFIDVDISDHLALKSNVRDVLMKVQKIDIVVNNTGGPSAGPLIEALPEQVCKAIDSHVGAAMILAQLVLEGMKRSGYGRIINVLSTSVRVPIPNLGVSNITRVAMASWAKTLVGEISQFGITINNILPGFTSTPRLEALLQGAAQKQGVSIEELSSQWKKSIPQGRFGDPGEVAQVITFLASPLASYINGVSLAVDGGRTQAL